MRVRTKILVLGALTAGLLMAAPAGAQDDHSDDGDATTTPTSIPDGIGLNEGIFVTGAVVTSPDGGEPRIMDELEAAVFVQSWIGSAFFCPGCEQREPPSELPVYRIDASGTWANIPGNVTAYYATDGTTPFISFPGIEVWTDPADIPEPSRWFIPPERVIDAFNGDAELIPTAGMEIATSVPGPPEEDFVAASDSSDSSSPWPWVVGAVVLAAALVGAGMRIRRRRRA